ncbi:MAG: alpha/beta hydrolase [Candidatus Hydrogenedentes bacterium]|nr:alpha/beta hydrolase [Candidatus Hydrogenedentota bacterium]
MARLPAEDRRVRVQDNIVYARPGGTPLSLTLYEPVQARTRALLPAVLLIHGGAWATGTRHQLRWYGRKLSEAGYVAASISYRKMPRHSFPACLHDAKSAVRWMRRHAEELHLDPDRIAVCGNSAGGHLAAMLAATDGMEEFEGTENWGYSSRIHTAISIYGALDLRHYQAPRTWIGIAGASSRIIEYFVGAQFRNGHQPFEWASPITHLGHRTAPMLFIHGDKDKMVPVSVSRICCDKLRQAGVPAEFICIPNRGHAFDHVYPRDRRFVFRHILRFLEEQFALDEAPLPRVAEG